MKTIRITEPERLDTIYYQINGTLQGFEYFLSLNTHLSATMQVSAGDKVIFDEEKTKTPVKKNALYS